MGILRKVPMLRAAPDRHVTDPASTSAALVCVMARRNFTRGSHRDAARGSGPRRSASGGCAERAARCEGGRLPSAFRNGTSTPHSERSEETGIYGCITAPANHQLTPETAAGAFGPSG
jgi:hypothetical protein